MPGFKLICARCGSEFVLEKSGQNRLDWVADHIVFGEGIERKCLECDNEAFVIFRTWLQDSDKY